MVKLADCQVIEMIPVGHAIIGNVKTAVAADNHVPAVVRIDPESMLISVNAPTTGNAEGLAAVRGSGNGNAQDIEVVFVAGIDADLTEVHRTRVDAVDPGPRIAAVGRLVDAAVLEALGPLAILGVLYLASQGSTERPGGVAIHTAAPTDAKRSASRPLGHRELNLHVLAIAGEFHFQLFADIVIAVLLHELGAGVNGLVVDRRNHIALLKSGFVGRAFLDDTGDSGADFFGFFAERNGSQVSITVAGLLRGTHADLFRFEDQKDGIGIFTVIIDPHASQVTRGQPLDHFRKRLAAVGGLVESTAGPNLLRWIVGVVTIALPFVGGDQQGLRIGRMHGEIDDAGLIINVEDLLPGRAAVGRLEEPALLIGSIEPAKGPDVNDVGIFGMDLDAARLEGLLEPHVLPGLAPIGRFVHAVAIRNGVARIVFARSDPDNVSIGGRYANVADGDGVFAIKLVLKGDAIVHCLEQPARSGCDPVRTGIRFEDRESNNSATHCSRTNRTPCQGLDPLGREACLHGWCHGGAIGFLAQLGKFLVHFMDLLFQVGDLLLTGRRFFLGLPRQHHDAEQTDRKHAADYEPKRTTSVVTHSEPSFYDPPSSAA